MQTEKLFNLSWLCNEYTSQRFVSDDKLLKNKKTICDDSKYFLFFKYLFLSIRYGTKVVIYNTKTNVIACLGYVQEKSTAQI